MFGFVRSLSWKDATAAKKCTLNSVISLTMERPSSDCERIFSAEKFSLLMPVLLSASSAQLDTGRRAGQRLGSAGAQVGWVGGEGARAAGRLRAHSAAAPSTTSSKPAWRAEHRSAHVMPAAHLSCEPAYWSLPKSQRSATARIAPLKLQLAPQLALPRGGQFFPALQAAHMSCNS